jgi:hypothetical protein
VAAADVGALTEWFAIGIVAIGACWTGAEGLKRYKSVAALGLWSGVSRCFSWPVGWLFAGLASHGFAGRATPGQQNPKEPTQHKSSTGFKPSRLVSARSINPAR